MEYDSSLESDGTNMIEIEIADKQQCLEIDRAWFSSLAEFVLREEGRLPAHISIAFVDSETIHRLNQQYLQHDFPTDVITFPLTLGDNFLSGEIVISTEFAVAHGAKYQWPAHLETSLYLVHGLLHLCGFDDHCPEDAQEMDQRQHGLLEQFLRQRGESCDYVNLQGLSGQQIERESCH